MALERLKRRGTGSSSEETRKHLASPTRLGNICQFLSFGVVDRDLVLAQELIAQDAQHRSWLAARQWLDGREDGRHVT